jgi:response regulator RpfG family c-di-GMP phosphodiesterase
MHQNKEILLVVDDEPAVRQIVGRGLARHGFQYRGSSSAAEALAAAAGQAFDLVITDICMPGQDGLWLLQQCKKRWPQLPVIMLTGVSEARTAIECLRLGADDYLMKPVNPDELGISVKRTLEKVRLMRENEQYRRNLESMVDERTAKLNRALLEIDETYQATLEALAASLDARERETGRHSQRVMRFTVTLARQMGVSEEKLQGIARGALLHDIGKIGVLDSILLKPGQLTELEWSEMRKHPQIGYEILKGIPFLEDAREIVLCHQERWDGGGYPRGLYGDERPLGARIFTVADTLDAMTSNRCYRNALPYHVAREEITRCSGSQFDPQVVEAFLSIPEPEWGQVRQLEEMRIGRRSDQDRTEASSRIA